MMADVIENALDQIVLFHFSDIHIGSGPMPSHKFSRGRRAGYNPHDYRLLRPLENAMSDVRKRFALDAGAPVDVIVSGDLTQSGLDNDYATMSALLHHRWQWNFGDVPRWLGLGLPRDRTYTVPGNHDHWRHAWRPTGYTRGLAPDFFVKTPWKRTIPSSAGALRLELFGLDSNAGFEDSIVPNLLARGAVSPTEGDDLKQLLIESPLLEAGSPAVIRALVCHHAFWKTGGILDAWPLGGQSRDTLRGLAARHDIAVVLTGHTHEFGDRDWSLDPAAGGPKSLKELRCATTLQGTRDRPGRQGFWVHQIARAKRSASDWQWTAWKYQFAGGDFDVDLEAPISFIVPRVRRPIDP